MSGRRNNPYGMDDNHGGGRRKKDGDDGHRKPDKKPDKDHDVDYKVKIKADLEGQAQLQGQGQGQGQHQSQYQKSYNSNHNSNKNYNKSESKSKSEAVSKVDVDIEGLQPKKDNDHIDVDVNDHAYVDTLLVSDKGDVDYNPGDDVSFEDILNDALNGKGNDTGIVFSQNGVINDNDVLKDPDVTNMGSGGFKISGNAKGGTATSDDGIDAGGSGGSGYGGSSWGWKKGRDKHEGKKHMPDGAGGDGGAGGMWGSKNGDDGYVEGISHANADGIIATEAFNQTIVQGANVLHNQVDMTVVGGGYTQTLTGEDADTV